MEDDTEPSQSLYSMVLLQAPFTEARRTIISKPARRAYINTILFCLTSAALLCISIVAYWIFYYNYVPQISLERQVHLQFGDGHPYGTATLGTELIAAQQYDVSVVLYLPRSPPNLAAGNFMVDLALFSSAKTNTNTNEASSIESSRRPAIMTYTSPMVDTAKRVSKMPLYLLGWQREAEGLKVNMMDRVEFGRKKGAMPKTLRLEIESEEKIQVYSAVVKFDAKFNGLRWIMYNWKIFSILTFTLTFWAVSMLFTSLVWVALASLAEPTVRRNPKLKDETEEEENSSGISVKEEEGSDGEGASSKLTMPHERRMSDEQEKIKREENTEEYTVIQTLAGSDQPEAEAGTHPVGTSTSSQTTATDNSELVAQRRRGNRSNGQLHTLESAGHVVSVVLPHRQRSWIGKAHLVGATVKPTYFRPGTLHKDDGTIHHLPLGAEGENDNMEPIVNEWILIDSTPASCVQIGLFHYFKDRGPIDLVISGPNYGRNSTAVFALSSGTLGGALEAAVCGYRSIALSYAFSSRDHDPVVIAEASRHSVHLIGHLYKNWEEDVDFYSINVPLEAGVSEAKILYTNILDNRWTSGSCFEAIDAAESGEGPDLQEQKLRQAGEVDAGLGKGTKPGTGTTTPGHRHMHFKWAPKFSDVYKSVDLGPPGNDGWTVKEGMTSVTRLKANFMHSSRPLGEIQIPFKTPIFYALVECQDSYVQPLVIQALRTRLHGIPYELIFSIRELPNPSSPLLQYRVYEQCDFEHVLSHPTTSLVNAYVIRKALIRKHYLSSSVSNWVAKHPDSILNAHVKPAVHFELDYAEFLDEALVEAYELKESFQANEGKGEAEKEWWILKPGMSDRGRGIRLFNSESGLREIFEGWEDDQPDSEDGEDSENGKVVANGNGKLNYDDNRDDDYGIITSQLRHFIAQPYIHPPLLLPSESNRKFHIRTYVLAVGSLQVYVYREMLALFAEEPYLSPWDSSGAGVDDLTRHLTNTCLQTGRSGTAKQNSVRRFWALEDTAVPSLSSSSPPTSGEPNSSINWKESVYQKICAVTGEVFEAAARGMLVHFQTLPNAFEVFGVDFLVDSRGKVWLLELNAFPDFRQTGDELKGDVVGKLFEAVVEVAVKPFFGIEKDIERAKARAAQLGLQLVRDLDMGMKR
ncbi:conserved hypothetical protein [Histoplasma mississippiense (nom. inval.)]|nr:conserved hypothetical protein [Histoplasma mississippiense (nom. inval.)]EDN02229.1 conserved hypothetical protein [Histoplasma mississippiense (nom. inval.)]